MNDAHWYDNLMDWIRREPLVYDNLRFLWLVALSCLAYWLTKVVLVRGIESIVKKTRNTLDDSLLQNRVLRWLAYIAPFVVVHNAAPMFPSATALIERVSLSVICVLLFLAADSLLTVVTELYEKSEKYRERPIKGYIQVVKLLLFLYGGILIVGLFTGQSPWTLLGGLGALTAVIILVFRDTILSFVASIQITSYDLVKVGDWIESPTFGADGEVVDIALHTVKVQNWDKTFTVIPTYKLIENAFKNWRGMEQAGGRRIKRAVNIDQTSVRFCDGAMLDRLEKFHLLRERVRDLRADGSGRDGADEVAELNGRGLTNLGLFRAYAAAYLASRQDIRKDMTFLVRQLQSGAQGLPLEVYVFTTTTSLVPYEDIQSEIFDHLLAALPLFDLKACQ